MYHNVPVGSYHVRVRAVNAAGASDPSNEVLVNVGGVPARPGVPSALTATVTGSTVTLDWVAPADGGPPSGYILEAGATPGCSNLAVFATGGVFTTISVANVPAGRYFVRVRGQNSIGPGGASAEIMVVVP